MTQEVLIQEIFHKTALVKPQFWKNFPGFANSGLSQTSADSTVCVLSLSRFCPDFPESPVRICCPVSVCPDSVCLDFVRCPDSVRISRKKSVWCLTGDRIFKNLVSAVCLSGFRPDIIRPVSGFSKIYCPLSVCSDFAHT